MYHRMILIHYIRKEMIVQDDKVGCDEHVMTHGTVGEVVRVGGGQLGLSPSTNR